MNCRNDKSCLYEQQIALITTEMRLKEFTTLPSMNKTLYILGCIRINKLYNKTSALMTKFECQNGKKYQNLAFHKWI